MIDENRNQKSQLISALQQLAQSNNRSKRARLSEIFDDVEAALASGTTQKQVIAALGKKGLPFTLRSFETTLARIRKGRNTEQILTPASATPANPSAPVQGLTEVEQEGEASNTVIGDRIGVPAEKIKLIFTIVPAGKDVKKLFSALFDFHEEHNNCVLDTRAIIYKTPLFDRIAGTEHTLESIMADETDWKQKIIDAHPEREAKKDEISFYSWMKYNRGLAVPLTKDFDTVFSIIMGSGDKANKQTKKGVNHA
ncbi:MAG: hypothetical protein WCK63_10260 [Betaproteobacteria bacterium]